MTLVLCHHKILLKKFLFVKKLTLRQHFCNLKITLLRHYFVQEVPCSMQLTQIWENSKDLKGVKEKNELLREGMPSSGMSTVCEN